MTRDADGWVAVEEAARRLGLEVGYVAAGRRTGRFPVERRDGSDWLRTEDVDQMVRERGSDRAAYVSYQAAAEMAGCSHVVVERAVAEGEIVQRPGQRHRGQPSLAVESAREWAANWRQRQEDKATARNTRRVESEERKRLTEPPDDEHVWLDAPTAALAVGVSVGGLRTMASNDRVPHARVGRRYWFRRDLLEAFIAARVSTPRFRSSNG